MVALALCHVDHVAERVQKAHVMVFEHPVPYCVREKREVVDCKVKARVVDDVGGRGKARQEHECLLRVSQRIRQPRVAEAREPRVTDRSEHISIVVARIPNLQPYGSTIHKSKHERGR